MKPDEATTSPEDSSHRWPAMVVEPTSTARPNTWSLKPGHTAVICLPRWTVTVAVHLGKQITAVWPGFKDQVFGLAVDVGSTTIAGHLCELSSGEVVASSGFMNPQIRFGEDLMSRVSYVMINP